MSSERLLLLAAVVYFAFKTWNVTVPWLIGKLERKNDDWQQQA